MKPKSTINKNKVKNQKSKYKSKKFLASQSTAGSSPLMTFERQEKIPTPSVLKPTKISNPTMTKVGLANARDEKYYKQFDFFFNRSCFRIMTEFYKEKFNQFYLIDQAQLKKRDFAKWQSNQKRGGLTTHSKAEMDEIVLRFVNYVFGADLLENLAGDKNQIILSIM